MLASVLVHELWAACPARKLRDIITCLNAHPEKLYHLGLTKGVKRSTLADANEERDYRIYEALAKSLIARARKLYQGELDAIELDNVIYALDSTTIELCLDVLWWAKLRRHKAAVKLHTLLDVRSEDGGYFDSNIALYDTLAQLPKNAQRPMEGKGCVVIIDGMASSPLWEGSWQWKASEENRTASGIADPEKISFRSDHNPMVADRLKCRRTGNAR